MKLNTLRLLCWSCGFVLVAITFGFITCRWADGVWWCALMECGLLLGWSVFSD